MWWSLSSSSCRHPSRVGCQSDIQHQAWGEKSLLFRCLSVAVLYTQTRASSERLLRLEVCICCWGGVGSPPREVTGWGGAEPAGKWLATSLDSLPAPCIPPPPPVTHCSEKPLSVAVAQPAALESCYNDNEGMGEYGGLSAVRLCPLSITLLGNLGSLYSAVA